jgi:hypothetical protein
MNHIKLLASFAMMKWSRFTAFQIFRLRGLGSTAQILSYTHLWISRSQKVTSRSRHAHVIHMLDSAGTLLARASQRLRARRLAVARSVAILIGIGLSMQSTAVGQGSIDPITPKQFIRLSMDKKEAVCLMKLYGKESAFNPKAIGNLSGTIQTYGIPQLKNPIIKDKKPIDQVRYGIKYIDHRYDGDTCKAWEHWIKKGWH